MLFRSRRSRNQGFGSEIWEASLFDLGCMVTTRRMVSGAVEVATEIRAECEVSASGGDGGARAIVDLSLVLFLGSPEKKSVGVSRWCRRTASDGLATFYERDEKSMGISSAPHDSTKKMDENLILYFCDRLRCR